jgi:hypothetical protein
MNEYDRRAMVRHLWLEQTVEKRDGNAVEHFHDWLEENRRELIASKGGDTVQTLKSDLNSLWSDQGPPIFKP